MKKLMLTVLSLILILVVTGIAQGIYQGAWHVRYDFTLEKDAKNVGKWKNVASAATLNFNTATNAGNSYRITGTLKCDSIVPAGADSGRVIVLYSVTTDTVLDGKNLKLAGDFNGTADDMLVLKSIGTSWVEVSRSAN